MDKIKRGTSGGSDYDENLEFLSLYNKAAELCELNAWM